jgi:hypothetical protein
MQHRPLETHWWNLSLVVAAATVSAGCGPLVLPEGPQLYSIGGMAWYALSGDFDGNGSTDLVTGYDAALYYIRSQSEAGSPSFACYNPYLFTDSAGNLAMGDFDGNGRDDMTISTIENDVSILLSQ